MIFIKDMRGWNDYVPHFGSGMAAAVNNIT